MSDNSVASSVTPDNTSVNSKFDQRYAESLVRNLIVPINQRYFKCQLIGFDDPPLRNNEERPLIYIGNHSGMAFPWDAMVFSSVLFKEYGFKLKHAIRPLAAPALSQSTLMNPFLIKDFWEISGSVEAKYRKFERMMKQSASNLLIYPEGIAGIGKGYNNKYQLQRFATSFVRMAIKYETDIIPFATVNGEYINPYVLSWSWLNKWSQKIGIPYIPVGFHTLLLLVCPWLFYFGLPARLTYIQGKRIQAYKMVDKPYDQLSDQEIQSVRDRIKLQVQEELDRAVDSYGSPRYSRGKFRGGISKLITLWYYTPLGWPLLFHEHHRLFTRNPDKPVSLEIGVWSGLKIFLKNPFTLSFYIPILGWIPILIRGYWKHKIK